MWLSQKQYLIDCTIPVHPLVAEWVPGQRGCFFLNHLSFIWLRFMQVRIYGTDRGSETSEASLSCVLLNPWCCPWCWNYRHILVFLTFSHALRPSVSSVLEKISLLVTGEQNKLRPSTLFCSFAEAVSGSLFRVRCKHPVKPQPVVCTLVCIKIRWVSFGSACWQISFISFGQSKI